MSYAKPESIVVKRAMQHVKALHPGGLFWRANSGGGKSGHRCNSENLPDIVGVTRLGLACFVEVKTRTGRLTMDQWMFLTDMERRNAWARVYVESDLHKLADVPDANRPRVRRVRAK